MKLISGVRIPLTPADDYGDNMARTHAHHTGQPASFADFLSLWEDLRDEDGEKSIASSAEKPGGLAEAVSTLGLGWIAAAMLTGKPKRR